MSRRGEIVVECLSDDGWARKDGKDFCPVCVKASAEPERDEAYERAAARARLNDFEDSTGRKDWT